MIREIVTESVDETFKLGMELGISAKPGDVFALSGELGTGKTVIAKGIAKGIGIDEDITSPTFALLEIYEGNPELYHFDLYRIESEKELDQLFFEEYWESAGISIIEWAERAGNRLPEGTIFIDMNYIDEKKRSIRIEQSSD